MCFLISRTTSRKESLEVTHTKVNCGKLRDVFPIPYVMRARAHAHTHGAGEEKHTATSPHPANINTYLYLSLRDTLRDVRDVEICNPAYFLSNQSSSFGNFQEKAISDIPQSLPPLHKFGNRGGRGG
jgi:hypothetical protein